MKQVYECDFCRTTNQDEKVVAEHEAGCRFNPANKTCMTCAHEFTPRFCDWSECEKGRDSEFMDAVQFGTQPCEDWKESE